MLLFGSAMQKEKVEQGERQLQGSTSPLGGGQVERCTIRAGGHYHRTGTHTTRQGSEVALQDKAQALHLRSCLTDAWR